jgi:TRAP transporter TAXI family solute receptor
MKLTTVLLIKDPRSTGRHETKQWEGITMKFVKAMIVATGVAALLGANAQAQTYQLTLAGASPGGLWSTIGAGLDKAFAKAYPGSTVTYQTGSGGLANAKLVADGKVPMGIVGDMELAAAYRGTGPFKGHALKDLRTLFRTYSAQSRFQYDYVLVNGDVAKQYNIKTMADLKKNAGNIRIAFNRPGNMDGDIGIAIIEQSGIPIKSFKQVVRAASKEQASLMLDRRIDAIVLGIAYNHPVIRQMENGIPLTMLDVGKEVATKVADEFGGQPCTIKASEHKFISEDKVSVCVGTVVVVNKSMSDQEAYNLTKGLLANLDDFKSAHRLLKKVTTPKTVAEPSVAPEHPGAAKAFKEAGLQ